MSDTNKNETVDATTHPSVYRDTINQKVKQNVTGCKTECKKSENKSQNDWDLYPNMIRQVENQGSPEQVEHLHDLEHTSSR
ncbi:hypothetical protein EDC94DRAFT_94678 [Helicostylum pulchrum]|uniref:Uncharacterized protein n=1 Tax=Helicostylum pulchrum TaxID=562976 RepID=A0ABP9XWT6_9FUNG|nr:hypothetical protein EDC94DRAFT_94678 [Helicostylum pulchrum]